MYHRRRVEQSARSEGKYKRINVPQMATLDRRRVEQSARSEGKYKRINVPQMATRVACLEWRGFNACK